MATSERHRGGCQCGAVRYEVPVKPRFLAVCHCRECQRASGSAFSLSYMVGGADFALLSGELSVWTRSTDTGGQLDCAFCPTCGTRIYHQTQGTDLIKVRGGTLDDTSSLAPQLQAWTSRRQPWVVMPDGLFAHETQP